MDELIEQKVSNKIILIFPFKSDSEVTELFELWKDKIFFSPMNISAGVVTLASNNGEHLSLDAISDLLKALFCCNKYLVASYSNPTSLRLERIGEVDVKDQLEGTSSS